MKREHLSPRLPVPASRYALRGTSKHPIILHTGDLQTSSKSNTLSDIHRAELDAIWSKDKRMPTLNSRRAWAASHKISPAIVHAWFSRKRYNAVNRHAETLPEGEYDLQIGPSAPASSSSLAFKLTREVKIKRERAASPLFSLEPGRKSKRQKIAPTPTSEECSLFKKLDGPPILVRHTRAHDSAPHSACPVCNPSLETPTPSTACTPPSQQEPKPAFTPITLSPTPSLAYELPSSDFDFENGPLTPVVLDSDNQLYSPGRTSGPGASTGCALFSSTELALAAFPKSLHVTIPASPRAEISASAVIKTEEHDETCAYTHVLGPENRGTLPRPSFQLRPANWQTTRRDSLRLETGPHLEDRAHTPSGAHQNIALSGSLPNRSRGAHTPGQHATTSAYNGPMPEDPIVPPRMKRKRALFDLNFDPACAPAEPPAFNLATTSDKDLSLVADKCLSCASDLSNTNTPLSTCLPSKLLLTPAAVPTLSRSCSGYSTLVPGLASQPKQASGILMPSVKSINHAKDVSKGPIGDKKDESNATSPLISQQAEVNITGSFSRKYPTWQTAEHFTATKTGTSSIGPLSPIKPCLRSVGQSFFRHLKLNMGTADPGGDDDPTEIHSLSDSSPEITIQTPVDSTSPFSPGSPGRFSSRVCAVKYDIRTLTVLEAFSSLSIGNTESVPRSDISIATETPKIQTHGASPKLVPGFTSEYRSILPRALDRAPTSPSPNSKTLVSQMQPPGIILENGLLDRPLKQVPPAVCSTGGLSSSLGLRPPGPSTAPTIQFQIEVMTDEQGKAAHSSSHLNAPSTIPTKKYSAIVLNKQKTTRKGKVSLAEGKQDAAPRKKRKKAGDQDKQDGREGASSGVSKPKVNPTAKRKKAAPVVNAESSDEEISVTPPEVDPQSDGLDVPIAVSVTPIQHVRANTENLMDQLLSRKDKSGRIEGMVHSKYREMTKSKRSTNPSGSATPLSKTTGKTRVVTPAFLRSLFTPSQPMSGAVAFEVDLGALGLRFPFVLPKPEREVLCDERKKKAILPQRRSATDSTSILADRVTTNELRATAKEFSSILHDLSSMADDIDAMVHPPRISVHNPRDLVALRNLPWQEDGFDAMELSALPWLGWVGEGLRRELSDGWEVHPPHSEGRWDPFLHLNSDVPVPSWLQLDKVMGMDNLDKELDSLNGAPEAV
ncbi:hypothetical protein PHLCEN_2v61 [Hermanssonia centrifuga]|uniref:Uncharacterized protein n=1 Tax=Hermanssonia centrifuga TaxID=98765 RepID=A0A2R6S6Z8_9APHY|nr:hypothetical protein PHLCEN_2v61 [Hermanssonia centrifuga]